MKAMFFAVFGILKSTLYSALMLGAAVGAMALLNMVGVTSLIPYLVLMVPAVIGGFRLVTSPAFIVGLAILVAAAFAAPSIEQAISRF